MHCHFRPPDAMHCQLKIFMGLQDTNDDIGQILFYRQTELSCQKFDVLAPFLREGRN